MIPARWSLIGLTALALGLLSIALWGCSSAPPATWMLYSRASYLYGRVEAKAEDACKPPVPAKFEAACQEAASVQKQVNLINPQVQAELSKKNPDWGQIFKYVDLIVGMAGKFLMVAP